MAGTHQEEQTQPQPQPQPQPQEAVPDHEDTKKWGTHMMGPPANPTAHPDNQQAALWRADEHQRQFFHDQPYLVYSPLDKAPTNNPLEPVIHAFNTWSQKAETIARNIWSNLKTGPSISEAAWGKINLTAKALTEGGFEPMFKQIFETQPDEKLKKTFACYLSTTKGPVAGTLYLSNVRVGFCSDRPLSFIAPSGQEAWSYYKVMIPLAQISTINPTTMGANSNERYIQMTTIDNHEFWFMGFVNFDKATHHLLETLTHFRASDYGPHAAASH
ncbi:GEM-like protein 5 [Chenopodium quinoa]|nr:GEM-like protein 5 [Chenopodium quinoa]